jgi:hypothetical protein
MSIKTSPATAGLTNPVPAGLPTAIPHPNPERSAT